METKYEGPAEPVTRDDPRAPEWLWDRAEELGTLAVGQRSEADLAFGNNLRNRGFGAGETLWFLEQYSPADRPGHRDDYLRRTVATAFASKAEDGIPEGADPREWKRLLTGRLFREHEQRSRAFALPKWIPTLAEELRLPVESAREAIEGLLIEGGNASLSAKYKTGKTTLGANLAAALADEELFLGRFGCVLSVGRRVGITNYELTPDQFREWVRDMRIKRPERIAVLHLRGIRAPLDDEKVAEAMIRWLRDRDVDFWIIDNRRRAMRGKENSNDDLNSFAETIDWIKEQAGVRNSLTIAHMGRREHDQGEEYARGATAFDDWVDTRWVLTREGRDRFFFAEGRDVQVEEGKLDYDPSTRRLTYVGGSRPDESDREVVEQVRQQPGAYTKSALAVALGGNKDARLHQIERLIRGWYLQRIPDEGGGKLYPRGPIQVVRSVPGSSE